MRSVSIFVAGMLFAGIPWPDTLPRAANAVISLALMAALLGVTLRRR